MIDINKALAEKGGRLNFDEKKHAYTLDGKAIPGVTTFLKASLPTPPRLLSWMIKQGPKKGKEKAQKAADIGKLVHKYLYYLETVDTDGVEKLLEKAALDANKEKILAAISQAAKWHRAVKDKAIANECPVACPVFWYAGTFDRLAERNGKLVLTDFKTSSEIYSEYLLQLAAYDVAIGQWFGRRVDAYEILRFGKDGSFDSFYLDDAPKIQDLEDQMIRCRMTYGFFKRWEDEKLSATNV